MQLDVLANSDVRQIAGVLFSDVSDHAKLVRAEQPVGDADAHHEVLGGFALATDSADSTHAIALGVDAPPLEVGGCPLGGDAGAPFPGKGAHFVESLPRVLFALQAFGFLCFRLFYWNIARHFSPGNRKPALSACGCSAGSVQTLWILTRSEAQQGRRRLSM